MGPGKRCGGWGGGKPASARGDWLGELRARRPGSLNEQGPGQKSARPVPEQPILLSFAPFLHLLPRYRWGDAGGQAAPRGRAAAAGPVPSAAPRRVPLFSLRFFIKASKSADPQKHPKGTPRSLHLRPDSLDGSQRPGVRGRGLKAAGCPLLAPRIAPPPAARLEKPGRAWIYREHDVTAPPPKAWGRGTPLGRVWGRPSSPCPKGMRPPRATAEELAGERKAAGKRLFVKRRRRNII